MMGYDEEMVAHQQRQVEEEGMGVMPGTSTQDPLTYDPTQGSGTPAWQAAVKRQMEHNAKLRRN